MSAMVSWPGPDPHRLLKRVVREITAGRVVGLQGDGAYLLAASALAAEAVERLPACPGEPLTLLVRTAGEARDWAPRVGGLGLRLARRSWPGPLVLQTAASGNDGLACRLPPEVHRRVCPDGFVRLGVPSRRPLWDALPRLAVPLVTCATDRTTAQQTVEQGTADLVIDSGPCEGPGPTLVQADGTAWTILRPGSVASEQLRERAACRVVFVCTGNTCRSPLAEGLFKKALAERLGCTERDLLGRGFLVLSAGLAAMMGAPAADEAVRTGVARGADLSGHRSRPLTAELVAEADFLVAMTSGHLYALSAPALRLAATPRLLDPAGEDLPDPIGQTQEVYDACAARIEEGLRSLLDEVAAVADAPTV
jgi:protein-tyrosine phosphatase